MTENNPTKINPSYERLVENAPVGIFQISVDSEDLEAAATDSEDPEASTADPEELYVNETLADILSFDSPEHLQSELSSVEYADPQEEAEIRERLLNSGQVDTFETAFVTNADERVDVLVTGTLEDGTFTGYVTDISDRKRLERKAAEQAEAILELSTPIVQIWDGITLATVVGPLDTNRAQRLTEELLTELTENESDIALIDITGVPNVDTATAQHLTDTVNAVSLLGSEVIITGINPDIAQTLVHLGTTMDDIQTKSTLSEGLELGLNRIRDDDAVANR